MSYAETLEILADVFGEDGEDLAPGEVIYFGTKYAKWELRPGLAEAEIEFAMYFDASVFDGTLKPNGELSRTGPHLTRMFCVCLDDIGTKFPVPSLPPSFIVETSPGNHQYVYILDVPLGRDDADNLCARIKALEVEIGDPGALKSNQLLKLPLGVNDKNDFPTRMVSRGGPLYAAEALIAAWGLPHVEKRTRRQAATGEALEGVTDPIAGWLTSSGFGTLSDSDSFPIDLIVCPFAHDHTGGGADDGNRDVGYSPIGYGDPEYMDIGNFFCQHAHCQGRRQHEWKAWVRLMGGPADDAVVLDADGMDAVADLIRRYALVGKQVADMDSTAESPKAMVSETEFRLATQMKVPVAGPPIRGMAPTRKQYELWSESEDTVRCRDSLYLPGESRLVAVGGAPYLNTYWPVSWTREEASVGSVHVFTEHVARLIPDPVEAALFHSWLAWKLQNPERRSYGMVMVADKAMGEEGDKYGTGRSTMGDVIEAMMQTGVARPPLDRMLGKGSQAAFQDWIIGTQLVISDETKATADNYAADVERTEALKMLVDTRAPMLTLSRKGLSDMQMRMYCNFLFFTNHGNALRLDKDDRRFCVLQNIRVRLPAAMADALDAFRHSRESLAALYWHYMDMDVSPAMFDAYNPPMTEAKMRMVERSRHSVEDTLEDAIAELQPVCTQHQLEQTLLRLGDEEEVWVHKYSMAKFKEMDSVLTPEGKPLRLWFGEQGKRPTVKILSRYAEVEEFYHRAGDGGLVAMLEENDRVIEGFGRQPKAGNLTEVRKTTNIMDTWTDRQTK